MWCSLLLVLPLVVVVYYVVSWMLSRLRVGNYTNKHVLITGCDTGFGHELVKRLDRLGFKVFAACLTSVGAEKLQGHCSDRVTTLLLDVSDEKSISAARNLVESRLLGNKELWGLVNNAGIGGTVAPTEWLSNDDWLNVLSINLMGMINVTREFLPFVRNARGRVVNVSSVMGRFVAASGPYCVSKYGVEAFSDCLRREVHTQGIRVCILEPGFFKTEILNAHSVVNGLQKKYDSTSKELRQHYQYFTPERMAKVLQNFRDNSSANVDLVIDAHELALTSRFPPTRQVIGYDARFIFRLLWNLPTPIADWITRMQMQKTYE